MSDLFLHHYPASLFSEKIRALLGHLSLPWNSVEIPIIMPRPKLMPLSGGYRRTPVLQIGANVYCDTRVIARALGRHADRPELFEPAFAAQRVADWADTRLFQLGVALNFSPEAMAHRMSEGGGFGGVDPAAFAKDRAELAGGAQLVSIVPADADAELRHVLVQLDESIGDAFLFGDAPTIADFAVYHGLWFLLESGFNRPKVEAHPQVMAWFGRMRGFGHGAPSEATPDAALDAARAATPVVPEPLAVGTGHAVGDEVEVTPTDYGRIGVRGRLLRADAHEIAIARETPETGPLVTHFPRDGFSLGG